MAKEVVVLLDVELREEIIKLCEEEFQFPEVWLVSLLREVGRVAAADLVVDHDGDAIGGGQVGER